MIHYLFAAGSESFRVKLDDKKLYLKGAMTNNKFCLFNSELFRGDRERALKAIKINAMLTKMSEEEKDKYIITEFGKMGYFLAKKWKE